MRVVRAALSFEVVLCYMSRFVSREARAATARLSRFAVWRFEAMWEHWWHVGALAVRKRVSGACGHRDAGVSGQVALAGCVRSRRRLHRELSHVVRARF